MTSHSLHCEHAYYTHITSPMNGKASSSSKTPYLRDPQSKNPCLSIAMSIPFYSAVVPNSSFWLFGTDSLTKIMMTYILTALYLGEVSILRGFTPVSSHLTRPHQGGLSWMVTTKSLSILAGLSFGNW